jgi:putative transposase
MGRCQRAFPTDSVLHVINRGNDRRVLFHRDGDFRAFWSLLERGRRAIDMPLLAYALMPNHWHLIVRPRCADDLARLLQRVTGTHAMRIRRESHTIGHGHVYQGRYHAFLIESPVQYLHVVRYVEANPLKAGLVRRAEDWRWSSLRQRLYQRTSLAEGPVALPEAREWIEHVNASWSDGKPG